MKVKNFNFNLGGGFNPPLFCLFLNNLETVEALSLLLCQIKFIKDTMLNLVSINSPNIWIFFKIQTEVLSVSEFLVKSFMNINCYKSKTSHDIDLKPGPLSKLEERNKMA